MIYPSLTQSNKYEVKHITRAQGVFDINAVTPFLSVLARIREEMGVSLPSQPVSLNLRVQRIKSGVARSINKYINDR